MSTSVSSEDNQAQDMPPDNTTASFELTDRLLKLPQTVTEFTENDQDCFTETVPQCPVCGKSLQWVGGNERLLNRHVDECLNEVTVNDLLANEKQTSSVNR